ncbi:hypothetical protein AB205_0003480 [Aquarana catesbeiana]|uniref:Beclin-1 n=1 Tax=Aquarana catesbeiana TaxID=8400 RepID=A0A2G9S352_AQUCT|nr:hypothetical protein AB205_0003480 [Aquarana catesbeiana]
METSKSSTMQVSFVCQRCSQPLKLDTSFNMLDKATMQELTAPLVTTAAVKPGESQEEDLSTEVKDYMVSCTDLGIGDLRTKVRDYTVYCTDSGGPEY